MSITQTAADASARPIRITTIERHRIIYAATHSVAGNTVVILRILGPGQNT